MKIIKKSILLEIPETLEDGSAKVLCDKPYVIERTENDSEVIWWGYGTNWKLDKTTNMWYMLIGSDFVNIEVPEYEKIYLELTSNKGESCLEKYKDTSKLIDGYSQFNPEIRAIGFKTSYDVNVAIRKYRHCINSGDVETVVKWLFESGYDIIKPVD
jgi:hypothetical protein